MPVAPAGRRRRRSQPRVEDDMVSRVGRGAELRPTGLRTGPALYSP